MIAEDGTQLDPGVLKVMNAIKQVESSGDYGAVGDAGQAHGAFQYNEKYGPGWKKVAKDFLGDENAPMNKANQNKATYFRIKRWKDQGLQPEEIAALWNGAVKTPDGKYTYKKPEYGVKFRQALLGQPNIAQAATMESEIKPTQEQPKSGVGEFSARQFLGYGPLKKDEGIGESIVSNTIGSKGLLGVAQLPGRVVASKLAGNVAGASANQIKDLQEQSDFFSTKYENEKDPSRKQYWQSQINNVQNAISKLSGQTKAVSEYNVSPEQALGIGLNAATTVAPFGMASKATLGRKVLQGAKLGAYAGIGQQMAEDKSAKDVVTGGLIGAATGGVLSAAGAGIQKFAEYLPERIIKNFIPTKSEGVVKYAATKPLGNPKVMLQESQNSAKSLGANLGSILEKGKPVAPLKQGQQILQEVSAEFPRAGLTPEEVADKILSIAPLEKGSVNKMLQGVELSADELHKLNHAIGDAIYLTKRGDPALKAGKDVANKFWHIVSDSLKTSYPESKPIFEQLSKEYGLIDALREAVARGGKAGIGLKDLLAFMAAGPLGTAASMGLRSPTINLKAAGALGGLAGKTAGKVGSATVLPVTKGILNATNRPSKD